jgi:tetratricopeptide (TPR) repeat protein
LKHRIKKQSVSNWADKIVAALLFLITCSMSAQAQQYDSATRLFSRPAIHQSLQAVVGLLSQNQFDQARAGLEQITRTYPWHLESNYLLASVLALKGETDKALDTLQHAIDNGFTNAQILFKDNNLKSLRKHPRFLEMAEDLAKPNTSAPSQKTPPPKPAPVRGNVALVNTSNTNWDQRFGVLTGHFAFNSRKAAADTVQNTNDPAAKKLNDLFRQGLAAGNMGDIYDNRDRKHSTLISKSYPQLAFSKYDPIAVKHNLDYGSNTSIIFNSPTFGNSSTALSAGPFWRSHPRLAYTTPGGAQRLFLQYVSNHLYVYPAVRDFEERLDLLPANSPYLLISRGKSGSDKPFLRAVATILAALPPAEKDKLIRSKQLMSTVQMIFRRGQKNIRSDADYLSSKAHPVAFDARNIDLEKMIDLAGEIDADTVPGIIQIQVLDENKPKLGVDEFTRQMPETLFNTPASIARIIRTTAQNKTFKLQIRRPKASADQKAIYKWVVLQGNPDKITITPKNEAGTKVDIAVKWHEASELRSASGRQSNRVELAVFADTGDSLSAPSFVNLVYPVHQRRKYDKTGNLKSLDHRSNPSKYMDPQIFVKRDWQDTYRYDAKGRLIGWQRTRASGITEFTYHGAVIVEKDALGRATKAEQIGYLYNRAPSGHIKTDEKPLGQYLNYEYLSDTDQRGILVKK